MFIASKAFRFVAAASTSAVFCSTTTTARCEEEKEHLLKQPSYLGKSSHVHVLKSEHRMTTLNDLAIITGSAHKVLADEISHSIGVPLTEASVSRFSDGEVALRIDESLHGKNVFIVQTCAAPVNDSIMELLLAVSCANRAAARRVIAVIPYFGYKHHRRGSPISTTLHSRFLSSSAMDFAKMLEILGVDHVITVDLQRPGQGHEACFFDNMIPLETIQTRELLIDYFVQNIQLKPNVVVISPNTECVKKAKQFQLGLKTAYPDMNVRVAVFDGLEVEAGPSDPNFKILLGDVTVKGADIVIVDDLVDTAGTLSDMYAFIFYI